MVEFLFCGFFGREKTFWSLLTFLFSGKGVEQEQKGERGKGERETIRTSVTKPVLVQV